jgi:pantoate--beta-alanine ligase
MIITTNKQELDNVLEDIRKGHESPKIGLVMTMGALHGGHMELIAQAKKQCTHVFCSVFVNPTQFNNPSDLATYPRTLASDITLLKEHDCDVVFAPDVDTVYPSGTTDYAIDLEGLDEGMEGTFRPGHFKGVCMVVERFLTLIQPDFAYFGKKDFQQLAIVKKLAQIRNLPVEIVGVPIARAENGLAMSSRNQLLTDDEREAAGLISSALKSGLEFSRNNRSSNAIHEHIIAYFEGTEFEVEYVAIIDNTSLKPVVEVNQNSTVCIVVYCRTVRLLDNMQFGDVL